MDLVEKMAVQELQVKEENRDLLVQQEKVVYKAHKDHKELQDKEEKEGNEVNLHLQE